MADPKENTASSNSFILVSQYAVPVLALLIALHQIVLRPPEASTWKGGGFGMYTNIHPSYYKVFVTFDGPMDQMKKPTKEENIAVNDIIRDVQKLPNEENLNLLADAIYASTEMDGFTIQVWKPDFDLETRVYSRSLLLEQHYSI